MKRRILSMLLAICLMACMLPLSASAEEEDTLTLGQTKTGTSMYCTSSSDTGTELGTFTAAEPGLYCVEWTTTVPRGVSTSPSLSVYEGDTYVETATLGSGSTDSDTESYSVYAFLTIRTKKSLRVTSSLLRSDESTLEETATYSYSVTVSKVAEKNMLLSLNDIFTIPANSSRVALSYTPSESGWYSDTFTATAGSKWVLITEKLGMATSLGDGCYLEKGKTYYFICSNSVDSDATVTMNKIEIIDFSVLPADGQLVSTEMTDPGNKERFFASFTPEFTGTYEFSITTECDTPYYGIYVATPSDEEIGLGYINRTLSVSLEKGQTYIVRTFCQEQDTWEPVAFTLSVSGTKDSSSSSSPTSSGSSGGSSSTETEEPVVTTNPDGSTTTTETAEDGTTTATTTWDDGKQAVSVTTPEGETTITVTEADGETSAEISIPAAPGAAKEFEDVNAGDWYKTAVDNATGYGLFNGTSETEFSPNIGMTRAMMATVLHNLSGNPEYGTDENSFIDVTANTWYEDPVDWAYKMGVTSGTSATEFSPNVNITREQLVTMLYRYAEKIGAASKNRASVSGFPDGANVSNYALTPMQWAVAEGFVSGRANGGKNYIAPQGTATRAEVATVLTKFVEYLKK